MYSAREKGKEKRGTHSSGWEKEKLCLFAAEEPY